VSGVPTKVLNKSTGVEKTDPLEAFVFLNEGNFDSLAYVICVIFV
jgi:hypothetical protein